MSPLRILGALLATLVGSVALAQTLVIESWRTEDKAIWEQRIIPVFQRRHPGITLKFAPTARELYDQTLSTRLESRIAGDLITCRPFDASLALYMQGHLLPINDLQNLTHFPPASRMAWQTDDGLQTFCLPIASVMHGIFYNKAIFRRLGLGVPGDEPEWFALMQRVTQAPGLVPLALGTADRWESHQLLFTSIGPNQWGGEAGRRQLLKGAIGLTDQRFVSVWQTMARLADFLPPGYAALSYEDAMELFGQGLAAMRPGGSWEIAPLESFRHLELGVFPPPVQRIGQPCQVSDHMDIGMGINPRSHHLLAARTFLDWLGSAEFTQLYANAAVGFYPLADHPVTVSHPLAREMMGWRQRCQTTVRLNAQKLNRGEPGMEDAFWTVNAMVLNHRLSPEQAGKRLQSELDRRRNKAPGAPTHP